MMIADAAKGPSLHASDALPEASTRKKGFFFGGPKTAS
jgi:hypothetical protein